MQKYRVIGLMSGTSLDGLDIADCDFLFNDGKWSFEIKNAKTIAYAEEWKEKLNNAWQLTAYEFVQMHKEFGKLTALATLDFIKEFSLKPDFISSHGHTIFHRPDQAITCQIGDGAVMSAILKRPLICDFRSVDVALNGQGAPLVPIGDEFLFPEFFFRLNLGGIANISYNNGDIIAYDICPFNMPLNYYAQKLGSEYDSNGNFAASGVINNQMLKHLNLLAYYKTPFPKSLGKEWFINEFLPIAEKYKISAEDKLRTIAEHIAEQITSATNFTTKEKILVTGGGAFNKFLISLIKQKSNNKIITPDPNIINYKEALIFAFLGVLRYRNEANCLRSVTGADYNNIGGCIYANQ